MQKKLTLQNKEFSQALPISRSHILLSSLKVAAELKLGIIIIQLRGEGGCCCCWRSPLLSKLKSYLISCRIISIPLVRCYAPSREQRQKAALAFSFHRERLLLLLKSACVLFTSLVVCAPLLKLWWIIRVCTRARLSLCVCLSCRGGRHWSRNLKHTPPSHPASQRERKRLMLCPSQTRHSSRWKESAESVLLILLALSLCARLKIQFGSLGKNKAYANRGGTRNTTCEVMWTHCQSKNVFLSLRNSDGFMFHIFTKTVYLFLSTTHKYVLM